MRLSLVSGVTQAGTKVTLREDTGERGRGRRQGRQCPWDPADAVPEPTGKSV